MLGLDTYGSSDSDDENDALANVASVKRPIASAPPVDAGALALERALDGDGGSTGMRVVPLASTRTAQQAGLVAYGGYEILLTLPSWTATSDPGGNLARLGAAVGVQLVVGYCFVVLRRQSLEAAASARPANTAGKRSGSPRMMAGPPPPPPPPPHM